MYQQIFVKQEEEFAEMFIPNVGTNFVPKLSNYKKEKLLMELRSEEKRRENFSVDQCNCFHLNDTIAHGIKFTCNYHQAQQNIASLRLRLDPYKLQQLREQRKWTVKMNANYRRYQLLKISPIFLFMFFVAASLFLLF